MRLIHDEDITIVKIYAPNRGAPRYTREILTDLKRKIHGKSIRMKILPKKEILNKF